MRNIKIKLGDLVQIIVSDHSKSKHVYLCRHSFSKAIVFV
jgi:translation initiation factor IF-1